MNRLRFLPTLIAVLALVACSKQDSEEGDLLLVTTTSLRDSGLLSALLPVFQEKTGIRPQVIAVGSGAALRMGRDGNADVLLTHAPDGEEALVASGAAASRTPVMENYFVIAGPPEDPIGVRAASSPADAIRRIADASARFVSRGDDSGTHRREVALFKEAGLDPAGDWPGFVRSGASMGQTLQIAGERRSYVLSDIGTFLAFQQRIELESLSQPAPSLRNVYSVVRIDPDRLDPVRAKRAAQFEAFMLDAETQRQIADFGRERFGRSLFRPLHLEPRPASSAPSGAAASIVNPPSLALLIEITLRTLAICLPALAISLAVGLPIGIAIGRRRFRGRVAVVSLINTGMGAPPVVVGLLVYFALERNGPFGDLSWLYSGQAMVLAQVLIALPLVVGITLAAVGSLDEDWELQVRTLGVPKRWQLWLLVREIRLGLLAAVITALGGILSEVGAVMAVGGNLEGETRVLTTSILMYTQMGELEIALGLAAILVGLMLVLAGLLTAVQQSGRT